MKKYLLLITLLLTGCSIFQFTPSQLELPRTISHNDKTYTLKKQTDLDSVARYVYWLNKQNAQNWQSAVELLLDRNKSRRSLDDRINLRKKVYGNYGFKNFYFYKENDFLYGYIIYEPNAQNKSWQVDVVKGKDIKHCGFVQYQYSVKVERTAKIRKMSKEKIVSYLKKYVADKELKKLTKADWKYGCVKQ